MALLTSPHTRPIREEIVSLAATLADTQERLQQVAARLEEDDSGQWEDRYEKMRVAHAEAINSAKWLRAQNAELETRVAQHRPEIDNALSAREAAFQKLKHARKVIRDLLAERADMSSPRSNGLLTQEEIDQALFDRVSRDDDSGSSDSNETVRFGASSQKHSPPTTRPSPNPSRGPSPQYTAMQTSPSVQSTSSMIGNFQTTSSRSEQSPRSPEQVSQQRSPDSSKGSPETWTIHFKKPPGSSVLQEGPISWTSFQNFLKDDDLMNSLHSLASSSDLSMRLQITQIHTKTTVACLYDPILVEFRGRSYILDWGRRPTNQNIEKYISKHKAMDSIFHTFIFPVREKNWFYVGALEWTPVQLQAFWPLDGQSRKRMLKQLRIRTRDEVSEVEMAKLLDSGELVQFCVELTAVKDLKVSHDFAAALLSPRASVYTAETRHERRPEGVKE